LDATVRAFWQTGKLVDSFFCRGHDWWNFSIKQIRFLGGDVIARVRLD
jgi:hypothetical protein